jgi:putative transposase
MAHQLNHQVPSQICTQDPCFYITQCALPRKTDVLSIHASQLVKAIHFYHNNLKWRCYAYVIMPDHLHLLVQLHIDHSISALMKNWKSYTARKLGIKWQKDFFEHRLRSAESIKDKAYYMELNPIRAGLVQNLNDWKWFGYLFD